MGINHAPAWLALLIPVLVLVSLLDGSWKVIGKWKSGRIQHEDSMALTVHFWPGSCNLARIQLQTRSSARSLQLRRNRAPSRKSGPEMMA